MDVPFFAFVPFLFFLILLVSTSNSTWAPFQSKQAKEVCAHMTARERRRAAVRGAIGGLMLGIPIGAILLLGMILGSRLFDSYLAGILIIQPVVLILLGILVWKLRPSVDRSTKEFLATTQWSKKQGLKADEINLRRG